METLPPGRLAPFFIALVLSLPAAAEWPTDPTTPLVAGATLGIGAPHAVVATPDQATWVAWIDHQCFPSLRVQRIDASGTILTAGALALDPQDNCINLTVDLVAMPDNSIVVSAIGSSPELTPVHRISPAGIDLWPDDIVTTPEVGAVHGLAAAAGGDTLIAGFDVTNIYVGRYAPDGSAVWPSPATFAPGTSSNRRIIDVLDDGAGGAFLVFDSPGAYTRHVYAMRIDATGLPAWPAPLHMVSIPPGSSRHSDPRAVVDDAGDLIFIWVQGSEQATTPVPIRMQRVSAGGVMAFPMLGPRVSLSDERQFDPQVLTIDSSGDVIVVWRDGNLGPQDVRAQRMTPGGERLWSDVGVLVEPLSGPQSAFALGRLTSDAFAVAVADQPQPPSQPSVQLHRIDHGGGVSSAPWPLSGDGEAGTIAAASLNGALAVVWQRGGQGSSDDVVAQRIGADGSLGPPDSDADGQPDPVDNCTQEPNPNQRDTDGDGYGNLCDADFNNDCIVNSLDLGLLRQAFFGSNANEDLNGDGVVNAVDLGIFKLRFFLPPGPSGTGGDCQNAPSVAGHDF